MQFGTDPGVTSRIIWYWAQPGAKDFPLPTPFRSRIVDEHTIYGPYGEVLWSPRKHRDGNFPILVPGAGNFCGSEQTWRYGSADPIPVGLPRNDFGLSECCGGLQAFPGSPLLCFCPQYVSPIPWLLPELPTKTIVKRFNFVDNQWVISAHAPIDWGWLQGRDDNELTKIPRLADVENPWLCPEPPEEENEWIPFLLNQSKIVKSFNYPEMVFSFASVDSPNTSWLTRNDSEEIVSAILAATSENWPVWLSNEAATKWIPVAEVHSSKIASVVNFANAILPTEIILGDISWLQATKIELTRSTKLNDLTLQNNQNVAPWTWTFSGSKIRERKIYHPLPQAPVNPWIPVVTASGGLSAPSNFSGNGNSATAIINLHWGTPTTAGSTLNAGLIVNGSTLNTSALPSGWQVITTQLVAAGTTLYSLCAQNAAAQVNTFFTANASCGMSVVGCEQKGAAGSSLDKTSPGATGTGTAASSGSSGTTSQAPENAIAIFGFSGTSGASGFSGGYVLGDQMGTFLGTVCLAYLALSSITSTSTIATVFPSDTWAGTVSTFS